ncbi:MAG: glycosyltransferase family 4 protein, partial [Rhodoferax sp.]
MNAGKRPLRVAVLNRVFSPTGGGAERYSIALVEQLAQRHEIHVFAQKIEHQWPGVTYHRVSSPFTKPRWINQLWFATATWWATRRGFDVVHSHENTWHGRVQTVHVLPVKDKLFTGRTGWRWLLRCLKVLCSPRLLVYLGLERLRFSIRDGRCIVVTSTSLMARMATAYPATRHALRVLTPGITAVAGLAGAARQAGARAQLGLPAGGQGILFVANDYRRKGLDTLLQALALLPGDNWLAVAGGGAQIREYSALAKTAGVAGRVVFLGPLKDLAEAYMAADCLAHPTLEDTFAMVVLEAMAHGLPVLVSAERYCGISALLEHGRNALILQQPRDAAALAQGLKRVLQDPALHRSLSAAALLFAALHRWPAIAAQQEAI